LRRSIDFNDSDCVLELLDWIQQQPGEVQRTLAFHCNLMISDLPIPAQAHLNTATILDPVGVFESWLCTGERSLQAVGKVLSVRAMISFVLEMLYTKVSYWERRAENSLYWAARFEGVGEDEGVESLRCSDHRQRMELWRAAAESWAGLMSAALSNESIDVWQERLLRRHLLPPD
jgi:hypothetical protein